MGATSNETLSMLLESADAEWRASNGATGRPVHKKSYWDHMASVLLANGVLVPAFDRITQAECVVAGILYEGSHQTLGACQQKAVRIVGALKALKREH